SKDNSLRRGLSTAVVYCQAVKMRCDFALQPLIFNRKPLAASEATLARSYERLFPGQEQVRLAMYRNAREAAPPDRMHNLTTVLDGFAGPFFTDQIHVNEAGNRIIAERLATIVSPPLP